jgi:hypothetical protein
VKYFRDFGYFYDVVEIFSFPEKSKKNIHARTYMYGIKSSVNKVFFVGHQKCNLNIL